MKKFTVKARILIGFATLFAVTTGVGLATVIQQRQVVQEAVDEKAAWLTEILLPKLSQGKSIQSETLLTMYANRAYGYSADERFFEEGQQRFSALATLLDESLVKNEELGLSEFTEIEEQMLSDALAYNELVLDTRQSNESLAEGRKAMDAAAAKFVKLVDTFAASQDDQLEHELKERMFKIDRSAELLALGNRARIANFKGQAKGEIKYFDAALQSLGEVKAVLDALDPVIRDVEDIARLDAVRVSSVDYSAAIRAFSEMSEQEVVKEGDLSDIRVAMDTAADTFVTNTEALFADQQTKTKQDIQERVFKLKLIKSIANKGNQARVANFKFQAKREATYAREAMGWIDGMSEEFGQLYPLTRRPVDIDSLDGIREATTAYSEAIAAFLEDFERINALADLRTQAGERVLSGARNASNLGFSGALQVADETMDRLRAANGFLIWGLVGSIALALVLSATISRSITSALKKAIEILSDSSNQTTATAEKIAHCTNKLSHGASSQASSLEETSASMVEMASMTKRNAESAQNASAMSVDSRKAADKGVGEMTEMTQAMSDIQDSSEAISKIINTIDEIAFQTNILALNAAVEAARAGEAGQGFAVVADEVRNLAQRSAVAARETAEKIEAAIGISQRGGEISERVQSSLEEIVEKTREVDSYISQIAAASTEQSQGISEINDAVASIDQITQANAISAEETAEASSSLDTQAAELAHIVQDFRKLVGS
ncbi:MAG: methyl-accepting chemotaxis protein [Opitutales bacterium]|nr:methyl-accepting chemotaxis protein [Opitutales bacterium]